MKLLFLKLIKLLCLKIRHSGKILIFFCQIIYFSVFVCVHFMVIQSNHICRTIRNSLRGEKDISSEGGVKKSCTYKHMHIISKCDPVKVIFVSWSGSSDKLCMPLRFSLSNVNLNDWCVKLANALLCCTKGWLSKLCTPFLGCLFVTAITCICLKLFFCT